MSERNEEMTAFLLSQQIASDPELRAEWNRKKAREAKNGAITVFILGLIGVVLLKGDWVPLCLLAMVASAGFYFLTEIKTFLSR